MATKLSVTVLAPNGRRQIVNVTPNSTILQILEEVCKKHEFDPLEYDLKHHNTVLDTTMNIQFSRLPNNAQLEMVKAKKIRRESEVLVNVQVESGERLSGTFAPSATLWDVVLKLCPDSCSLSNIPSILYMRQEILGMENLQGKTLRDLGLTGGRALLRYTCKSGVSEVPKETGVTSKLATYCVPSSSHSKDIRSVNITQYNVKEAEKSKDSETLKKAPETGAIAKTSTRHTSSMPPPTKYRESFERKSERSSEKNSSVQHSPTDLESSAKKKQRIETGETPMVHSGLKRDSSPLVDNNEDTSLDQLLEESIEPRERNAVIFKQGLNPSNIGHDLPDEFFDLTLDDVNNIYRDLKKKRAEMDETPLQTSAIRKLEESKRILNQLQKYKRAVLRIQFPDQTVLQGSFSPVETVQSVHEFVKGYLQDPTVRFYLYTTPPKEVLSPSSRLIEVNCVPCALLHFGMPDGYQASVNYLRPELLKELSSAEVALEAAAKSRGIPVLGNKYPALPSNDVERSGASTSGLQTSKVRPEDVHSSSCEPTAKQNKQSNSPPSHHSDRKQGGNPNGKVPKWFKVGPK